LSKRPVNEQGAGPGDGTDYKALYEKERARLVKLWDAYEKQDGELRALRVEGGDAEARRLSGAPQSTDGQTQDLERFAQALIKKEEHLMAREVSLRVASESLDRERESLERERDGLSRLLATMTDRVSQLEAHLRSRDVEIARLKALLR